MKIAIVGHGPLTRGLAPFNDPEWTTWGISFREYQHQSIFGEPRGFDVLWECHDFPAPPDGYDGFMEENGVKSPDRAKLSEVFTPEGFGNSLSLMIAEAILLNPDEIALFGCDCSIVGKKEYGGHVPNIKFFLGFAAGRGIKLYAPYQSGLWDTSEYGV